MQRDAGEIRRYARLTENHQLLDNTQIAALEPDLSERFEQGLLFAGEAHLDPRLALAQLVSYLRARGGEIHFEQPITPEMCHADRVIDCRGYTAGEQLAQLRGLRVKCLFCTATSSRCHARFAYFTPAIRCISSPEGMVTLCWVPP